MTDSRPIPSKRKRVRRWLTLETTSGGLLIVAALIAIVWANSPWRSTYFGLSGFMVGPSAVHLDLSLAAWATDGLLAVFFFVVGVELKHEVVAGSLRNVKEAAVPVLAAVGGMVLPAAIFIGIVLVANDPSALPGWAVPTATDIAFALAILAIFGRGLPPALRTFLLTLAVVDDLLAIVVIAVFYTAQIHLISLFLALIAVAVFALLVRLRSPRWWMLLPVALVAWTLMHDSGIHATIAGVLLGLVVPARLMHNEGVSRTHRYEHDVRIWSSAIALPVFAFFSAGVSIVDGGGAALFAQPVVVAIVVGLVLGKLVGVLGTTVLVTKFTALRLPESLSLRSLVPVGFLSGIGFTVSLLIAELSFPGATHSDGAKAAILSATVIASVLAAVTLRWARKRVK
ncbi:MAG: Na+/H+ antiporter NhaA [Terrimesophilobacter sp.]